MGQTALKMWCAPLRKRLCAAGVMKNRDRRGPLARSDHRRRDHRGGPRPVPRRPGAPRTTRVQSSERVRPRDRLGFVPRDRPGSGAAVGYLFSITNPVEWLLGLGFLTIAILWDYYRLNPKQVPWVRCRT